MIALRRSLLVMGGCLMVALLVAACGEPAVAPTPVPGKTGATGAVGAKGDRGPGGPAVGVVMVPAEIVQGKVGTLMGWGFQEGEAWIASIDLPVKGVWSVGGPSAILSGGEANMQGVINAVANAVVGAEVGLIPAAVPPGFYLVKIEGSAGTKASTTVRVLPAPTPTPKPIATAVPAKQ